MSTIWTGKTGMRVVLSGNSVQLWPDRSPVAVTMTVSEWADVASCAARYPTVGEMKVAEKHRATDPEETAP